MGIIHYYILRGTKYGSFNAHKIQCMGNRDCGSGCIFSHCHLDEFLANKDNVLLSEDWNG